MKLSYFFALSFFVYSSCFAQDSAELRFSYNPEHKILSGELQERMDALTHSAIRTDNHVVLLTDMDASFEKKIEIIRSAQEILMISTFFLSGFGDDDLERLLQAVIAKSQEGVPVYLIIDSFQSITSIHLMARLKKNGVQVAYYNTTLIDDGIPFGPANHEKYVIADYKRAILGGRNQSYRVMPGLESVFFWVDKDVYVEGSLAADISLRFLALWEELSEKDPSLRKVFSESDMLGLAPIVENTSTLGHARFLYNEADRGKKNISDYYEAVIDAAQDIIVWQGNYLDLPDRMVRALIRARERGVRVILATNSFESGWWTPSLFVLLKILNGSLDFDGTNVEILDYKTIYNHSKVFYVDGVVASIGSLNHDYMSIDTDSEGTLVSYDREFNRYVFENIVKDLKDTQSFKPEYFRRYKIYKKYLPFLPYPLVNVPQEEESTDEQMLYVGAGLEQSLAVTKDIFLNGRKLNDDVYLIIGMNNVVSDAATLGERALHHLGKTIVETPENVFSVLEQQIIFGQEVGDALYANTFGWVKQTMNDVGESIEIDESGSAVLGTAFVGIAKGVYYVAIKLPVSVAFSLVKDVAVSSHYIVHNPLRAGAKLVLTTAVLTYGTVNTLIGTTFPFVATLYAGALTVSEKVLLEWPRAFLEATQFQLEDPEFFKELDNPVYRLRGRRRH